MSTDRDTISLHNIEPDGGIRLSAEDGAWLADLLAEHWSLPDARLRVVEQVCNILRGHPKAGPRANLNHLYGEAGRRARQKLTGGELWTT